VTGLLLLAILIGCLLPLQAGVNARLGASLGDPVATALVSFGVGTIGLLLAVFGLRIPIPLAEAWSPSTWWLWTGGLLGAIYIAAAVVLAPRLGAATLVAAMVGGQMVASLLFDHFGWIGFAEHPINAVRLAGAGLVILGVLLIQR
jgi:bacterial/archaeal transporter family-2 protein